VLGIVEIAAVAARRVPAGRRLPTCWQAVVGEESATGADCSTVRLMEASALSSDERVLSTTIFHSTSGSAEARSSSRGRTFATGRPPSIAAICCGVSARSVKIFSGTRWEPE